jgi:hypothetical protein
MMRIVDKGSKLFLRITILVEQRIRLPKILDWFRTPRVSKHQGYLEFLM